ncbi:Topoisomerase IV subunit A [Metamycoplasma auris 15026]|uniref:DNA topoisomerase (ATP-hydrolyzing) n=1 Tax=Metamycoplasma auris 15026 TaxID=1188233 RepID=N9TQU1_9BACT|nr:DNA topoisomerase (ATP-hydrolyzing) [Metamycoplasma auris]ENY68519.1 Topoisomerase IV subunit A [Metamycoplasma auris 15026]
MAKDKKNEFEETIENIIEKNMIDIMNTSFSRFSKYVIQQRAIPDARDGLKPVQRRILYSMWNLKLRNKDQFKKSARIVGDVLGKYHPHGDSSVYEAMVRMAQEWKSNYPLVQMHGNKGSIDDDPAAAMRYTESRLEKISEYMLMDLEKKVVPMIPNFDDSEYEPTVLPTLFPNLLLNGAIGIASGFATQIPPHNLNELIDATIAMIKNKNISVQQLMEYIKGPDFPTGGVIYGISGIEDAFNSGKGKISLSAKYDFIKNKKDKIIGIEITEIPFGVIKSKLVFEIDSIIAAKTISGIKEIRDQSDRDGLSIYIELEEDSSAEAIITYLMNKTKLRINYDYNMMAIYKSAPTLLSLDKAIYAFLEHLSLINTKAIKYDLKKYKLRHEIIEGFIKVAEISDQVIKLIKESDNSKKGVINALMVEFNFSEIQATAIAELRLYKLSKIDQIEFQNEKISLEKLIANCKLLLDNENEFNKYLIKQLNNIKKEFGRERRTAILNEIANKEVDYKSLTKNEDFYFFFSQDGYIKKITPKIFNSNDLSSYKLKNDDAIFYYNKINSFSKILFFTNKGNFFILEAHILKDNIWKELGIHISSYINLDINEKVIRIMEVSSFDNYLNLIMITKLGYAKKIKFSDLESKIYNRKRSCISFKNEDDELVDIKIGNDEKDIFILLNNGLYFLINENEFSSTLTLKAQGIKLLPKLNKTYVAAFATVSKFNKILMLTQDGLTKIWNASDLAYTNRSNRGTFLFNVLKNVNCIPKNLEVITNNLEFLYTNKNNEVTEFNLNNIENSNKRIDKLSNNYIESNNSGYLIQHLKIEQLNDPDDKERNELKNYYLKKIEDNKMLVSDIKETMLQRYYFIDENVYELKSNSAISNLKSNEKISIFDLDKNEENFANKIDLMEHNLENKLRAMEDLDLDSIEEKVKQITKK